MSNLSLLALACLASVSCQAQQQLKPQGPAIPVNNVAAYPRAPQVQARQLYGLPQGQQFYPDLQFALLNPQLDIPSLGYIPDKQTFPGVQPQVLLYPGGASPGQPFLLQPGAPPGNFLIPQPQPGPGPNVFYKGVPNRPSVFVAGYPKPAHIPPIEKDAEEIPTNPEKIPPFPGNSNTDTPKRKRPEKLETFNEDDNARSPDIDASEAPGLASANNNPQSAAQPKPSVNSLRPGQRFFVLNGIPIYSNYPFANSPDFNLRFSQPEQLPFPIFPSGAPGLPLSQPKQPEAKPQDTRFQFGQTRLPEGQFQIVRLKAQENNAQLGPVRASESNLKLPLKNSVFQPDPNTQTVYHIVGAPKGHLPEGGFHLGAVKGQLSQAEKQAVEAFAVQEGLEPKFADNYLQLNQPTFKQESIFRTALPLTVQGKDQETVQLKFGQKDFKLQALPLYTSALDGDAGYFQYDSNGEHDDDSVVVEAAARDNSEGQEADSTGESSPSAENAAEPSISQAHPGAIALAGPGGVAAAGPRGTALVGAGGLAVTSPQATAVAGPSKDLEKDKQKDEKNDDKKQAGYRNRKSRRQ